MASELVSLLILIISGGLFFLVALAISSLGTRINPLPSTARNLNGNAGGTLSGDADEEHDHDHGFAGRLSAEATLIGRSVQAAALMSAALATFAIVETGSGTVGSGRLRQASAVSTSAFAWSILCVSNLRRNVSSWVSKERTVSRHAWAASIASSWSNGVRSCLVIQDHGCLSREPKRDMKSDARENAI